MEIKGYNTKDIKQHKLFNLPKNVIEIMNTKSSNRNLNLSEYISYLILSDSDVENVLNDVEKDILNLESNFLTKLNFFEQEKNITERKINILKKEYLNERNELYKKKDLIMGKAKEIDCNNELLRPLAITILRNYLYNGGIEKANTLLNSMSIANRINKNILEKEFNRVKGIYDTYNKKEKKEFENATRDLQELKTTKLPKGL